LGWIPTFLVNVMEKKKEKKINFFSKK